MTSNPRGLPTGLDTQWAGGADSYSDPRLPAGYYVRAWNCSVRGGVLRTRPGSRWYGNLPGTNPQAFFAYTPRRGFPQLVAVVDGLVYVASFPFDTWRRLPNIRLDPRAEQVYHAVGVQAVTRNPDGSTAFLPFPKFVLVLQDGVSSPAWYDGYDNGHDSETDGIPLGTAMVWAGNRLWVARDNRLVASDIFNPRSFREQFYLGGSDSLLVPGKVTALATVPGAGFASPAMLAFTANSATSIRAGLPRDQWPTTPDFQVDNALPVGCISARSLVTQRGLLWWFTQRGLTRLDVAARATTTAEFPTLDNEMSFSRQYLDGSEGRAAAGAFGNCFVISVPYGDTLNTHTWVYDTAITNQQGNPTAGWVSVWTGWNPVEWATVVDGSDERTFCLSKAKSGVISIHEVNVGSRDSGRDIEARVELRTQVGDNPLLRTLRGFRIHASEILGEVDIAVDWRGFSRGRYKRALTRHVHAGEGVFEAGVEVPGTILGFRSQSRRIHSPDLSSRTEDPLGSTGGESRQNEARDWGFNFLVSWVGQLALREFTPITDAEQAEIPDPAPADEDAPLYVRFDGASSRTVSALLAGPAVYSATQSATGSARGITRNATRSARSLVSQRAAERMARQAAQAQVDVNLQLDAPPLLGLDPRLE